MNDGSVEGSTLGVAEFVLLFGLAEEFRPVSNRAGHHARIDEVEFLCVSPWIFYIIDVESQIWWCAGEISPRPPRPKKRRDKIL